MAIGHLKIGKINFTFVFRHRFEKSDKNSSLDNFYMWREWELGFWFKRYDVVGRRNFHRPDQWKKNMVHDYMFGINLLICKAWITVSKGAMSIEIN